MFAKLEKYLSDKILHFLSQPTGRYAPFFAPDPAVIRNALQPGDIVLVEGNSRLSAIIKYLTQSTWSHAALYVGERPGDVALDGEPNVLLEAEADTGVVTVPLSKYFGFNIRICRPVGLDDQGKNPIVDYALAHIGKQYDTRQIVDLARYLFLTPGAGLVSPTHAGHGRRQSDQGDLFDAYRCLVRLDPLPDTSRKCFDQRQDLCRGALCGERK